MLSDAEIRKLAEDALKDALREWEHGSKIPADCIETAIRTALNADRLERDATLAELRTEVEDGTRALASCPCDGTTTCPCEPGNRCIPCKCVAVLGDDAPPRRADRLARGEVALCQEHGGRRLASASEEAAAPCVRCGRETYVRGTAPAAPPADVLEMALEHLRTVTGTHTASQMIAALQFLAGAATYRSSRAADRPMFECDGDGTLDPHDGLSCAACPGCKNCRRTAGAGEALEATNAFYYASWEVGMRDAANIADCYTNGRDAAQEISAALKRKRAEWDARARAGTPTGGDSGTAKRGSAPPGVSNEGIETHGAEGVQKSREP